MNKPKYGLAFARQAMTLAARANAIGLTLEFEGTRSTSFPWVFKKGWDRVKSFQTVDECQAFMAGVEWGQKR